MVRKIREKEDKLQHEAKRVQLARGQRGAKMELGQKERVLPEHRWMETGTFGVAGLEGASRTVLGVGPGGVRITWRSSRPPWG